MPEFVLKWAEQSGQLAVTLLVIGALFFFAWRKVIVPTVEAYHRTQQDQQKECSDATQRLNDMAWGEIRAEREFRREAEQRLHDRDIRMITALERLTSAIELQRRTGGGV